MREIEILFEDNPTPLLVSFPLKPTCKNFDQLSVEENLISSQLWSERMSNFMQKVPNVITYMKKYSEMQDNRIMEHIYRFKKHISNFSMIAALLNIILICI